MTGLGSRLVAASAAALLLVSSTLAISRARVGDGAAWPEAGPALVGPSDPAPSGRPAPSPAPDPLELLRDPDAATRAGPAAVLAAGLEVVRGPWADLLGGWEAIERPVYVGTAELAGTPPRVTVDLAVAFRADDRASLPLRLLPAAATRRSGTPVDVTVTRDGRRLATEIEPTAARLVVELGPAEPREPILLRIHLAYDVPTLAALPADGSAASVGLLAATEAATVLGHWLPLLTVPSDDGPMLPWGDVAGFPAAVWSLRFQHDGEIVSSASEAACVPVVAGCSWLRGVALRDLAVVAADDLETTSAEAAGVTVRTAVPRRQQVPGTSDQVLAEAAAAIVAHVQRFGPLAWPDVEVVASPLGDGAAGMEFPGLVLVDTGAWAAVGGGFGSYVVTHEVAHQWFHALLGNGSLSAPVVDESLAQYGAYLTYADLFGESAAETLARGYFAGRYADALAQGVEDAPPGQPLDGFVGRGAYGPLVYGRGALAWVEAERLLGRDVVVGFIAAVVADRGLGEIGVSELVARAETVLPPLGELLRRYWLAASPG